MTCCANTVRATERKTPDRLVHYNRTAAAAALRAPTLTHATFETVSQQAAHRQFTQLWIQGLAHLPSCHVKAAEGETPVLLIKTTKQHHAMHVTPTACDLHLSHTCQPLIHTNNLNPFKLVYTAWCFTFATECTAVSAPAQRYANFPQLSTILQQLTVDILLTPNRSTSQPISWCSTSWYRTNHKKGALTSNC
jgi:hypothetical protein